MKAPVLLSAEPKGPALTLAWTRAGPDKRSHPTPLSFPGRPPVTILAWLERHAHHAQGALAPETERALRRAAVAFTGRATAQGLLALPTAPETAYVDALATQGRKPASIRQVVWAIATLHALPACPTPPRQSQCVWRPSALA